MSISVERIENAGFRAWSPDETVEIDGWTVASSGGFTRRLNSASARHAAETSLATRDAVAGWLGDRGAALTVRVTPLMDGGLAAECEVAWGLESVDDTLAMVREPRWDGRENGVLPVAADDPVYTAELFALNQRNPELLASWNRIVERIGDLATGLWIPGKAVGFTVVCDGISSVFSVAIHPEHRRQGLATEIMNASARWAVEREADCQFIQVLGTNHRAVELYEGLGFTELYRYRYLQIPEGQ